MNCEYILNDLPVEILVRILLSALENNSKFLSKLISVCYFWKSLLEDEREFWPARVEYKAEEAKYLCGKLSLYRQLNTVPKNLFTAQQISSVPISQRRLVEQLVKEFVGCLQETDKALFQLQSGKYRKTANFDIFEFTLTRSNDQLTVIFNRLSSSSNLSGLIEDPKGRECWESHFGQDTLGVTYESFENCILKPMVASWSSEVITNILQCTKFFINFPPGGLITPYKFNLFLRQFGPYHEAIDNVVKFVLGKGFIGLVTLDNAAQLLRILGPGYYLLRFSAGVPSTLSVAYFRGNEIYHYRKPPTATIGQVVELLSDLKPIPFHFDPSQLPTSKIFIPQSQYMSKYAVNVGHYYSPISDTSSTPFSYKECVGNKALS